MAGLVGELVQSCKESAPNTMRRVHIHLFWSARSILCRALVRHHQCEIISPCKCDNIRIGIKLHNVLPPVEGHPNGSNCTPTSSQSKVIVTRASEGLACQWCDSGFEGLTMSMQNRNQQRNQSPAHPSLLSKQRSDCKDYPQHRFIHLSFVNHPTEMGKFDKALQDSSHS